MLPNPQATSTELTCFFLIVQNDTLKTSAAVQVESADPSTTSSNSQLPPPSTPIYSCPLYRTPLRTGTMSSTGHSTNYVMCVDIPIEGYDSDYWISRGTALLCQTG